MDSVIFPHGCKNRAADQPANWLKSGFNGQDGISLYTEDLKAGRAVSRRYSNRRIGEFLRELDMTEGRSTGTPKILKEIRANGSPAPLFETDDDRLAFVIRLPRHPLAIDKASSAAQVTGDVTGDVTEPVAKRLSDLTGAMSRRQIRESLGLTGKEVFRLHT